LSYRFEPGERADDALARLSREEIDAAVAILSSDEPLDHRVHEARKHLKKLRALLLLGEASASTKALERAVRAVRKAARSLAGLRGRAALRESFAELDRSDPEAFQRELVEKVTALLAIGETAPTSFDEELEDAARRLRRASKRIEHLRFEGAGWRRLEPGFRRNYARGRSALARASENPHPESLHAFRTPAKRHLYHLQLMEPLWPELLHPHRKELARLGDLLGEHHDLSLLGPDLSARGVPSDELEAVQARITARSHELERQIFELGRRLFAERPPALARRIGAYFERSRRGS